MSEFTCTVTIIIPHGQDIPYFQHISVLYILLCIFYYKQAYVYALDKLDTDLSSNPSQLTELTKDSLLSRTKVEVS